MSNTNKSKVYRLTGLGILTAIIVVLQVLTTYFPTPFSITLSLIPIIIGAAFYGPKAGAYLGAVFSVVVLAMCISGGDVGGAMVWNANPFICAVVCLLKGTAAGFVSGLVYNAVAKKNEIVGIVLAAVLSPIVNTGIFYAGMLLFFRALLEAWVGGGDLLYHIIFTLTGVNFLIELGVNIVLVPIIVQIIKAVRKTRV